MKQRVNFKTIYLIATITVGLLGLAIGSTYAIFTTSAEKIIQYRYQLL